MTTDVYMVDIDDTVATNLVRKQTIEREVGHHDLHTLSLNKIRSIMTAESVRRDVPTKLVAWLKMHTAKRIFFVSSRPYWLYQATLDWFHYHGLGNHPVILRGPKHIDVPTFDYKLQIARVVRPSIIIDDDIRIRGVAEAVGAKFLLPGEVD